MKYRINFRNGELRDIEADGYFVEDRPGGNNVILWVNDPSRDNGKRRIMLLNGDEWQSIEETPAAA